jgi:hypothetical protein
MFKQYSLGLHSTVRYTELECSSFYRKRHVTLYQFSALHTVCTPQRCRWWGRVPDRRLVQLSGRRGAGGGYDIYGSCKEHNVPTDLAAQLRATVNYRCWYVSLVLNPAPSYKSSAASQDGTLVYPCRSLCSTPSNTLLKYATSTVDTKTQELCTVYFLI